MPFAYGLLIGSAALAAYIVLGYPLLLTRRNWSTAPHVRKEMGFQPTVSVIMAVHNGAAHLGAKLEVLAAFDYPRDRVQIIVVSDGSTDETETIAERFERAPVTLLKVPRGGKAAALNHALAVASGEILFLTDVRQPLDPLALSHLAANFADPTVGAATGELKLLPGEDGEHKDMDLYWRYEVLARKRHSDIDSLFTTTGCIYAMRRSLAEPIPPDTLTRRRDDGASRILPRISRDIRSGGHCVRLSRGGWYRIPTPLSHSGRPLAAACAHAADFHAAQSYALPLPVAQIQQAGVTVGALDLRGRKYRPASFAVQDCRFWLSELAFVLLAVANRFVPKGFPLKRISSPAQTFLVMNAAALAAVAVFFVPATRLWKPTRVAGR